MEERLLQIRQRSAQVIERLSPGQRLALMMLALIIVATLVGLVYVTSRTEFATLYSGVDERFGGQVVSELQARKIPHEIGPGGGDSSSRWQSG